MDATEMYDYLVEVCGISEKFLDGAICMGGYNEDTMLRVLFYNTGYRTFEQLQECEFGEEE